MRRKQIAAGRDDDPRTRLAPPALIAVAQLSDPAAATSRAQSSESAENPLRGKESAASPSPTDAARMRAWRWGSAPDASFAGVDLGDMTGTGKIAAVVPLSPHDSGWRGIARRRLAASAPMVRSRWISSRRRRCVLRVATLCAPPRLSLSP